MQKIILITGATDGIGLETAKKLVLQGHTVLLHGRNQTKLENVAKDLAALSTSEQIETYLADMSRMSDVEALAKAVADKHEKIDALINNAGIFRTADSITEDGLDVRFVVNTLAPYLLTQRLLPLLGESGRVINLSSAAQASVSIDALTGEIELADAMSAYAQSKLALTIWSRELGLEHKDGGPVIVAVNPGSLLASKMVKEGFGVAGKDLSIGADILCRAALSDEFAGDSGQYFDNDAGRFSVPHADALNQQTAGQVVRAIEATLTRITS